MAFLVIGGVTVKVDVASARRVRVAVGEVRRAFSGKPRSSVSGYKDEWAVETVLIPRSEGDTLRAALEAAPPITVTGDLTGAISAYFSGIQEIAKARITVGAVATEYVRIGFTMQAA